jgi:multidrug efflux pump subunit AcrA (membrane-fusion protein)
MQKKKTLYSLILFTGTVLFSCKPASPPDQTTEPDTRTPVTVASVSNEPVTEYIELNATAAFLQKWPVKANATGYLQISNVQLNKRISGGQVLYTVKTKEAQSIGNTINQLDSSFKFTGINTIRAFSGGFISQVDHQSGDYVQDGEQLAVITDTRSFVFLMDVPYELRPYVMKNQSLEIVLPDGRKLPAMMNGSLPSMDATSQTERIILKVDPSFNISENLIATVKLVKNTSVNTMSVPKTALLTDETQEQFWVMKMTNSTTAIKVPVKKGIEAAGRIEILSPTFGAGDKILITGNYGLPDTAHVTIIQP